MDTSPRPHYTSTACQHELHDRCRRTCKFCPEDDPLRYCRCACHTTSGVYVAPSTADEEKDVVHRIRT